MTKTSYKDFTTYQLAYKTAIDLHRYIEKQPTKERAGQGGLTEEEKTQIKGLARAVIGNIAEAYSNKTPKAKRFFNFKALNEVHTIMMDLDFLHDTKRIAASDYLPLYEHYDKVAKGLYKENTRILEAEGKTVKA